ncbi:MlaD family protein [Actinomadura scrupuli]|uniref:MlaD family protein n=1 Tax=Actinomadura scrupuli TaxID=559629 RepID=UPI003D973750
MRRLCAVLALVLTAAMSGCSYQTAGSPQGGLTLTADFTDIQNLVVGHAVQISNVQVGTVTAVKVVGTRANYRARVTMSIKKGIKVPVGTTAQLSITSLLGENYVALTPPPAGLNTGPFMADHAQIGSTSVVPAFEQVVGKAGPLLSALSGNDIATIVDAGSAAFAGKGPELAKMIKQTDSLLSLFASQRAQLDAAVTDLAKLGRDLAKGRDELGRLPAGLAKATKVIADERYRLLDTISKITQLAKVTNDTVLVGRTRQLRQMITQLGPVIGTLASDQTNLAGLITNMQDFVNKVPRAIFNGQLLLYPILDLETGQSSNKSADNLMAALTKMMAAKR